ncbi:MAG: DNA-3-methyladenine glycosylase 2 family protein [Maritimibacter sp.]
MDWLIAREPRFAAALELTGPPPLRRWEEGFAPLLRIIMGQQVSTASAAAIWARIEAAGLDVPAAILAAGDEDLKAVGMSRGKMRYARALAGAGIEFDALRVLPDGEVITQLTAVPGIGRWTAEIYAMFCLGRPDVLASGDLALQEGARGLFDLPERPREAELRALAEEWSPWRSVAARALWAYYRVSTNREGITP